MPYSKTPMESTDQTKDIKLFWEWDARDRLTSKDNSAINVFYEKMENKETQEMNVKTIKRDGCIAYPFVPPSTNIRGYYYWEDQNKLFIAYDTAIAIVTATTGVLITTLAAQFAAGTTTVGFTEFAYDTNTVKIVVTDGLVLKTIDAANVVVTCSDPDIPTPHIPSPIFLDGYLFLAKTNSADIYNSNLNDPLLWTSGDFITAEYAPDQVVEISKLNNYIVAFGSSSIEYFWDAGNATGSPLQRYDTPVKFTGYLGGLAVFSNKLYFVGNNATGTPEVYELSDLKLTPLSNDTMKRYVEPYTSFKGACISNGGHDFYVVTVGPKTYWVDIESKLWTQHTFQGTATFPIKYAISVPVLSMTNGSVFIMDGAAGLYYFDQSTFQDAGVNFTVVLQTNNLIFDTYRIKFGGRLLVMADADPGSLMVSFSDDDYVTFSTPRALDLTAILPDLLRFGQFHRRAWRFTWTENQPLRIFKVEFTYKVGTR